MGVRVFVPMQSATGVPLSPATKDYIGAQFTYRKDGERLAILEGGNLTKEYGPGEWVGVENY